MTIQWTGKASSDLVRLHEHLSPVASEAAARVIQQLAHAPAPVHIVVPAETPPPDPALHAVLSSRAPPQAA